MDRINALVGRHARLIVAAWLVLLAAAIPFSLHQTDNLTSGGFTVPGSGSQKVEQSLKAFQGAEAHHLSVVLAMRPGADAQAVRREIDRVDGLTGQVAHVKLAPQARQAAQQAAGRTTITVVPLQVTGSQDDASNAATKLRDRLHPGRAVDGVEPHLVGQEAMWAGMQDLTKHDLQRAERTGFPIVFVILLAVFGSIAAAALPLALGFASVTITGALIYFLSQATEMSVFVTNVASMIGIGVAVDYSLFVLARYREEVVAGVEPAEARRVSMRTSGIAVAFSGVTVMISLAGLFLIDSSILRSIAIGAIIVVAFSILGAVTLLPALMKVMGRRAYVRGRVAVTAGLLFRALRSFRRRAGSTHPERVKGAFWQRWSDAIMRRPVLAATGAAAVMLVLAYPALSLKVGDGALRQLPPGNETRQGAELAAKAVGPGAASPVMIEARFHHGTAADPSNRSAVASYLQRLRHDRAVARVQVQPASGGRAVLVAATPSRDPESPATRGLVSRVRGDASAGRGLASVALLHVGGNTAQLEDFKHLVFGSMWKVALFVAAFSYLVLFALLRSVLLPLKAVVMNLLSVAAAYGVLVTFFQWGWFDSLFGYHHLGYINTMTPAFLLAITFGLSMDYEVFLLSRIRERYDATGDTREAVGQGLARSARTITSAALIMVAVFAVFAGIGVPSVKEIGLGLAVAIALDATIVRLVLVPAFMEIMGRWNWWLPRSLATRLPRARFESSGRADEAAARA
ncbi:MAG: MMPL family transporter [Gaiellaceae bacterium]